MPFFLLAMELKIALTESTGLSRIHGVQTGVSKATLEFLFLTAMVYAEST